MSPAALRIQIAATARMPARYDSLPPWLLSTIVHMLAVIGLGLMHVSTIPGSHLQILFVPAESEAKTDELDASVLADFDVALDAEPIAAEVVDVSDSPMSDVDLLASFETELSDLVPRDGISSLGSDLGGETIGHVIGSKGYASLFGLSGEGGKFVYVFDRSESMNSVFTLYSDGRPVSMITPLLSAKQELIRSLTSLSTTSEFQIVFYNDSPRIFGESHYSGQLYPATSDHKEQARAFIEQMRGQGFTNHLSALEVGVSLNPNVIFLLTDAEAKDDLHPSVVRRIARYCQGRDIVINVVHFCNVPRPESTLVRLAEETGGEHRFISLESLAESMIDPAAF